MRDCRQASGRPMYLLSDRAECLYGLLRLSDDDFAMLFLRYLTDFQGLIS